MLKNVKIRPEMAKLNRKERPGWGAGSGGRVGGLSILQLRQCVPRT